MKISYKQLSKNNSCKSLLKNHIANHNSKYYLKPLTFYIQMSTVSFSIPFGKIDSYPNKK